MYRNQTCVEVFNAMKKLPIFFIAFTLISAITKANGEFYCSENGPFSYAQLSESDEGWQMWHNYSDRPFYINHKTKQMRGDDPTSFFAKSPGHKKITLTYPSSDPFNSKKDLFITNFKNVRWTFNPTSLTANRSTILSDSYDKYGQQGEVTINHLKKLRKVQFEDHTIANLKGDSLEEWFWLLFSQIFDPGNGFFRYVDQSNRRMQINPESKNSRDLNYFKFIGRVFAAAIRSEILIDVDFVEPYYQIMLGQPIHVEGESADETTRKALREKYLTPVQDQLCAFLEGFAELIPLHILRIFSVNELQLVIGGESTIDVNEWKNNVSYFSCPADSGDVRAFWEIVDEFTYAQRKQLLRFVTGSPRLPVGGFSALHSHFQIECKISDGNDEIPGANQSLNRIILSGNITKEKIEMAIQSSAIQLV